MTGFGFGTPWLLLAALAVAAPYVAHLVRYEDRAGRAFPSLMFLRQVPFSARSRRKLADRALLALRMLAVVALVLSFARPYLPFDDAAVATPQHARVVLLDRSFSMGSGARFERARAAAQEALRVDGSSIRVALVVFDTGASTLSDFASGSAAALQALQAVQPGTRATDLSQALAYASRVLAGSVLARRELILISDLQSSGVGNEPSLASNIELHVQRIDDEVPDNLAVLGAWYEQGQAEAALALHVRLANTGAQALSSSLRVFVDGLQAASQTVSLEAGARRELVVPIFVTREQLTRVQVTLGDDALAIDNDRYLLIAPPRPLAVLWLAGTSRGNPYVNAALSNSADNWRPNSTSGLAGRPTELSLSSRGARLALHNVDVLSVAASDIEQADVIVLDGLIPDTTQLAGAIERRVAQGAGLLRVMGEAQGHAGRKVTQSSLAPDTALARAIAGVAGAEQRASISAADTALRALTPEHALAVTLQDASLSGISVWRYQALQPRDDERVLLRFEDGAPAMIERSHGAGRSVTLALPLRPDSSDLVLEPAFVPLLSETLLYLSQRSAARMHYEPGDGLDVALYADTVVAGEAMTRALRAHHAVQLRAPSGAIEQLVAKQRPLLEEPGFYELRTADAAPLPVAVNTVAAESLLDALAIEQFIARLRSAPAVVNRAPLIDGAEQGDTRIARWLLWLAITALLGESLLGARLARQRMPQPQ
jgi:hypothetical protein